MHVAHDMHLVVPPFYMQARRLLSACMIGFVLFLSFGATVICDSGALHYSAIQQLLRSFTSCDPMPPGLTLHRQGLTTTRRSSIRMRPALLKQQHAGNMAMRSRHAVMHDDVNKTLMLPSPVWSSAPANERPMACLATVAMDCDG